MSDAVDVTGDDEGERDREGQPGRFRRSLSSDSDEEVSNVRAAGGCLETGCCLLSFVPTLAAIMIAHIKTRFGGA